MDNKQVAKRLADVKCRIYDARDVLYGMMQIADSSGAAADRGMASIETLARMTERALDETAEELQTVIEEIERA